MKLHSTGEDAYFAASNSASGFFSRYRECFDTERIKHLYAVKGGPGTGKSRFLREVAKAGKEAGWSAEYIYCSSDPDSLDGVILTRGENCIALLDATAPHLYEPTRPGVREEIINLGEFWNTDLLVGQTERIEALNAEKGRAWSRAYRYLSGFGDMSENRDTLTRQYLNQTGIEALATRLMREIPAENEYKIQPALIRSVGMKGCVGLDTFFAQAKRRFAIEDCHGVAQYLMAALCNEAAAKRLSVRISYDPVLPDRVDGLFLRGSGVAFAVCLPEEINLPCKRISVRRFLDLSRMKPQRGALVYAERMRRAMLAGAVSELRTVRELHFQIESVYMSAMDFHAKESFTGAFCQRLFPVTKK